MNAKVYCDGTRIRCLHEIKLTVRMSGAPVEFDFSSEWDGLGKTAVFTCDGTKDVILDAEGKAVVPHEILTTPGMDVVVGVHAVREDGTTWPAPTPLCRIGRVETGADPSGDESYPPTLDVGEQAVAAASKALEAAAEAQEVAADIQRRADAGEFDGKDGYTPVKGVDYFDGKDGATGATGSPGEDGEDGEDGGYYTPAVTQPDDTTMRVNFTPSKSGMASVSAVDVTLPSGGSGGIAEETDPTVPAWAKNPNKPTYTAAEVGALPADTKIPTVPDKVSAFTNDAGYVTAEDLPTVPAALPNPNKLTFSGAVAAEYDGSEAVEVVIPEGGGGIPLPPTAEVGQFFKVSAVENGKVTAVEAVEAPKGEEVWEQIIDYTVPEQASSLLIDKDLSGNSFSLKKCIVTLVWLPMAGWTENSRIKVGFTPLANWGVGSAFEAKGTPTETQSGSFTHAVCEVINNFQYTRLLYLGTNCGSAWTSGSPNLGLALPLSPDANYQLRDVANGSKVGPMTCLKLSTAGAQCILPGSIIRMWGVRA